MAPFNAGAFFGGLMILTLCGERLSVAETTTRSGNSDPPSVAKCTNGGLWKRLDDNPLEQCECPSDFYGSRCQFRDHCKSIIDVDKQLNGDGLCAKLDMRCDLANKDKFLRCLSHDSDDFFMMLNEAIAHYMETNKIQEVARYAFFERSQGHQLEKFGLRARQSTCLGKLCNVLAETCLNGKCVCNRKKGFVMRKDKGCVLADMCGENPCPPGSSCVPTYDQDLYSCVCPVGFKFDPDQTKCVILEEVCKSPLLNKCQHNCTINRASNRYECSCLAGYIRGDQEGRNDHMCFYEANLRLLRSRLDESIQERTPLSEVSRLLERYAEKLIQLAQNGSPEAHSDLLGARTQLEACNAGCRKNEICYTNSSNETDCTCVRNGYMPWTGQCHELCTLRYLWQRHQHNLSQICLDAHCELDARNKLKDERVADLLSGPEAKGKVVLTLEMQQSGWQGFSCKCDRFEQTRFNSETRLCEWDFEQIMRPCMQNSPGYRKCVGLSDAACRIRLPSEAKKDDFWCECLPGKEYKKSPFKEDPKGLYKCFDTHKRELRDAAPRTKPGFQSDDKLSKHVLMFTLRFKTPNCFNPVWMDAAGGGREWLTYEQITSDQFKDLQRDHYSSLGLYKDPLLRFIWERDASQLHKSMVRVDSETLELASLKEHNPYAYTRLLELAYWNGYKTTQLFPPSLANISSWLAASFALIMDSPHPLSFHVAKCKIHENEPRPDVRDKPSYYNLIDTSQPSLSSDLECQVVVGSNHMGSKGLARQLRKASFKLDDASNFSRDYYFVAPDLLVRKSSLDDFRLTSDFCEAPQLFCDPQQHDCVNNATGPGYKCKCRIGFNTKSSTKSETDNPHIELCEDIDECLLQLHPCAEYDAQCVNEIGSFRCNCPAPQVSIGNDKCSGICDEILKNFANNPNVRNECHSSGSHVRLSCEQGYVGVACEHEDAKHWLRVTLERAFMGATLVGFALVVFTVVVQIKLIGKASRRVLQLKSQVQGTPMYEFSARSERPKRNSFAERRERSKGRHQRRAQACKSPIQSLKR